MEEEKKCNMEGNRRREWEREGVETEQNSREDAGEKRKSGEN